jgi:hypothetical protein
VIASQVAAFWSYTHEDNELDKDGIIQLADNLRSEFSLMTGEDLTLFVDRTDIHWGDEWRARIDDALSITTFFIPIITARYFTRDECRRELLEFSSQAQSLGVSELVLPILYTKVKDLSDTNPDEAVALVARMQHVDWTKLRLAGSASSEYRTAVNDLARRLAELAEKIAEKQLSGELQASQNSGNDELGLLDIFDRINRVFPAWRKAVEDHQIVSAQDNATFQVYQKRFMKAQRSGPASAQFALIQRLAFDELPLAEKSLRMGQEYATKTIELNPLVLSAARIGATHPSDKALFIDLHDAVSIAYRVITESEASLASGASIDPVKWTAQRAHISRAMKKLSQVYVQYRRTIEEANKIVLDWAEQLKWLD